MLAYRRNIANMNQMSPLVNNLMDWKKGMLSEITGQYPRLAKYDWRLTEGDPITNVGGGYLEFRHPKDNENPFPGHPTIEVYPSTTKLPREELKKMIYGDMLHYLPEVDPEFRSMRGQLANSFTDRQRQVDRMAYQRDVKNSMDHGLRPRSYPDYMDRSRLDAYVRGYLAPDRRNEWAKVYNPEQKKLLNAMQNLLGQR